MHTYLYILLALTLFQTFSQISSNDDGERVSESNSKEEPGVEEANVRNEDENNGPALNTNGSKFWIKPEHDEADPYHAETEGLPYNTDLTKNWPLGIVHFYIDNSSYDHILEQRLLSVMDSIGTVSCVQFHQRTTIPDMGAWLHFTNPKMERKCVHRPQLLPGGEIMVVLGLDCLKRRDILHSVMHGIGVQDEVTHPQRDRYVRVMWENIQPEYRPLFTIVGDMNSKTLVEYDPMSIMHFHDRAFSLNGKATIAALVPGLQINPSDSLSLLDKMKLRMIFGHECNRRQVDNLLDTCKNVLTGNSKDGDSDQDHETENKQEEQESIESIGNSSKSLNQSSEDAKGDENSWEIHPFKRRAKGDDLVKNISLEYEKKGIDALFD